MIIKLLKLLLIISFVFSFTLLGCETAIGPYKTQVKKRSVATTLSDSAIFTKVKTGISRNKFVDGRLIIVDVYYGVVTLTGTVKSESMRITAGNTARRVKNVRTVKNFIKIK